MKIETIFGRDATFLISYVYTHHRCWCVAFFIFSLPFVFSITILWLVVVFMLTFSKILYHQNATAVFFIDLARFEKEPNVKNNFYLLIQPVPKGHLPFPDFRCAVTDAFFYFK